MEKNLKNRTLRGLKYLYVLLSIAAIVPAFKLVDYSPYYLAAIGMLFAIAFFICLETENYLTIVLPLALVFGGFLIQPVWTIIIVAVSFLFATAINVPEAVHSLFKKTKAVR